MKEEERLSIKENVNDTIQKLELFEEKKALINELEQDEKVKEYINLKKSIYEICKSLKMNPNDFWDEIVFTLFEKQYIKEKNSDMISCEHDLCIYLGRYFSCISFEMRSLEERKCDIDPKDDFGYYKYQCIECNKILNVKDYKKFGQEHIILKTDDSDLVQKEYFHLLMKHPVDESQKIIVKKYGEKR